jgi:hypothetical protein
MEIGCGLDSSESGYCPLAGSSESSNEAFIEDGKLID